MKATESSSAGIESSESAWRAITASTLKTSVIGIVAVVLVHGCVVGKDAQRLLGFAAGSGTGLLLLGTLPGEVGRLTQLSPEKWRHRFLAFLLLVKYPLLALFLYPLFGLKWADPLAFAGGFVLVQVALVWAATRRLLTSVRK